MKKLVKIMAVLLSGFMLGLYASYYGAEPRTEPTIVQWMITGFYTLFFMVQAWSDKK